MATFAALLAVVLAWGVVSGRMARYSITLPIVLVAMGAVLSATDVVVVELDSEAVRTLVELALSILLFADATEISARWLRSSGRLPLRMLALGFPLTVATGFAAGYWLLPGVERLGRRAARGGAGRHRCGAGLTRDHGRAHTAPAAPDHRRRERPQRRSGDPARAVLPGRRRGQRWAGRGRGTVGPRAGRARHRRGGGRGARRRWSTAARVREADELEQCAGERLAVLVVPMLTYFTAAALGGNGFIAAFVAGIAAGTVGREEVAEERLQLTNDVGTLLSAAVWFVFGSLIPDVVARGISWNVLLYAVLSLTLVRMVPVALALVRSGLGARDVVFLGWIGPRGLASILFGLIAIEELHAHGLTAAADSVAEVIVVTVGLSVLLHGLTAGIIAARWPADRTQPNRPAS